MVDFYRLGHTYITYKGIVVIMYVKLTFQFIDI